MHTFTKKSTRQHGRGYNIEDLGDGYDENDDFIDNSEAVSKFILNYI